MTTVSQDTQGMADECKAQGGLAEVTLEQLREELGYKKLGRGVLEEIRGALAQSGLGYFPYEALVFDPENPPRHWHTVWIYLRDGGQRAQVIDAILDPANNNVRGALDGLVGGDTRAMSADQKLDAIRALIVD
jgi:hypothetical protein